MPNREMYNSSGCLDMTAYIAIRNIENYARKQRLKNSNARHLHNRRGNGNNILERRCNHDR